MFWPGPPGAGGAQGPAGPSTEQAAYNGGPAISLSAATGAETRTAPAGAMGRLIAWLTNVGANALLEVTDNAAQTIRSAVANGATAVGTIADTVNDLTNATAVLLSIRSAGTKRMEAYYDGVNVGWQANPNAGESRYGFDRQNFLATGGSTHRLYQGGTATFIWDGSLGAFYPLLANRELGQAVTAQRWRKAICGGLVPGAVLVAAASYTTLQTDCIVGVNFAGAVTVTLTSPTDLSGNAADGSIVCIKDESGAGMTNNITVVPAAGGGTIDGAANKVINTNFGSIILYRRGGNWFLIKNQLIT